MKKEIGIEITVQHFPTYFNHVCYCLISEHWRAEDGVSGRYMDSHESAEDAMDQLVDDLKRR